MNRRKALRVVIAGLCIAVSCGLAGLGWYSRAEPATATFRLLDVDLIVWCHDWQLHGNNAVRTPGDVVRSSDVRSIHLWMAGLDYQRLDGLGVWSISLDLRRAIACHVLASTVLWIALASRRVNSSPGFAAKRLGDE